MTDPVFTVGDKVTPIYTSDYHLTMGKVYEVVIDDRGKLVVAHARRFKLA